MAGDILFKRSTLALSLLLSACSTDALSPSARFDAPAEVGSIRPAPSRNAPPETRVAAYPADAPVQAVDIDEMISAAPPAERVTGLAEEQAAQIAEGPISQPVVDGIGTNGVQALDAGSSPQPDAAAAADPDLPLLTPERIAAEERRKATFLEQEQQMMLQRRQANAEQQVAFLPRAGSPMSVPEAQATEQESEPEPGALPASEIACRQRLTKLGVEFREVAPVSNGGSCGIAHPLQLSGLSGGIDVKPAVKLNCQVTEAFALWVRNELAPAARYRYLTGIRTIKPLGGYSCRTMNSRRGAAMSEHARGNAIDIGKFVLKSGKEIDVRKPGFFAFREKGLLKAVRGDSCKYFTTVLGPGSDPFHKDHFHFDLSKRKSGYRHCD